MIGRLTVGVLAWGVALAPAFAQTTDNGGRSAQEEYQRGYAATPMPGQAAIDAHGDSRVGQLNNDANARSQAAQDMNAATAGANQAQYDADRAAYMDALVRHDRAVNRTDARYRRQQNGYADAMAVWRAQATACKRGDRRACNRPAPNPADFY